MDNPEVTVGSPSRAIILFLVFFLLGLICLLIFLYKKLNREANGEYTIRRLVYKEGGVRDRVRGAALALGTFLGVRLWPRSETDEDGEEMQEIQDEEGQLEKGGSQGDSEGSDQEEEEEQEEEEDDCVEQYSKASDDNTSLEGSQAGEKTSLDLPEKKEETEVKKEEKDDKVGEGEGKGEASGGAGLLIDLKQFSGSAIWSEAEGGEGTSRDVTAL